MKMKGAAAPVPPDRSIELIARGVLVNGNRILLVRKKNGAYAFLPGGHIEPGESAKKTLVREIMEETGSRGQISRFLGVVEHAWRDRHGSHQEINLIFIFRCRPLCRSKCPRSCEAELEFFWQPLNRLRSVNLQPWILQSMMPRWLKTKKFVNISSTL